MLNIVLTSWAVHWSARCFRKFFSFSGTPRGKISFDGLKTVWKLQVSRWMLKAIFLCSSHMRLQFCTYLWYMRLQPFFATSKWNSVPWCTQIKSNWFINEFKSVHYAKISTRIYRLLKGVWAKVYPKSIDYLVGHMLKYICKYVVNQFRLIDERNTFLYVRNNVPICRVYHMYAIFNSVRL